MKTAIEGYRKGILFVLFGGFLFGGLWVTLAIAGKDNLLAAAALYTAFTTPLGAGFMALMSAYGKSYAANAEIAVGQIAATPQTAMTAQSANVQVVAASPVPP